MTEFIESLSFNKFEFPVIANVSAELIDDPVKMKKLLCEQITSPVLWYPTIMKMDVFGIEEYYEIGPGKVLQGLLKRSLKGKQYSMTGIDRVEHINKLIGEKV